MQRYAMQSNICTSERSNLMFEMENECSRPKVLGRSPIVIAKE